MQAEFIQTSGESSEIFGILEQMKESFESKIKGIIGDMFDKLEQGALHLMLAIFMVELLKSEQQDDNDKKEYCEMQLEIADDKKKGLERLHLSTSALPSQRPTRTGSNERGSFHFSFEDRSVGSCQRCLSNNVRSEVPFGCDSCDFVIGARF